MKKFFFFLVLSLASSTLFSQDEISDSLSYSQYMDIVMSQHPIAWQAELKGQEGEYLLKKARGGFDPKLEGNASQKYFDGSQYYSYLHGGLKIPTWFGVELGLGYDINDGYRLNNESLTPDFGLWNAGVTVNLGKGMFMDQRRADVRQAKVLQNSTALEKQIILNELSYNASLAYYDWLKSYLKVELYQENISILEERLENIKQKIRYGDLPVIDTLKVTLQIQERSLKLMEAKVEFNNKRAWLSTFLWQDGFIPLEIDTQVLPMVNDSLREGRSLLDIETILASHPFLELERNSISVYKIENSLKREALKPTIALKYNALNGHSNTDFFNAYSVNNYKWGATISYPLFTRKERGDLKLGRLKVEQSENKLIQKQAEMRYKLQSAYNNFVLAQEQLVVQEESVEMYRALLEAEQKMFNIGESSLFLINTRDQNMLAAELKLIELKYQLGFYKSQLDYIICD